MPEESSVFLVGPDSIPVGVTFFGRDGFQNEAPLQELFDDTYSYENYRLFLDLGYSSARVPSLVSKR